MPHKVYWSESVIAGGVPIEAPHSKDFADGQWTEIMTFMEQLRARGRKDGTVTFVALSSEVPGDVTKKGVDVTGPDYDWKKRRL